MTDAKQSHFLEDDELEAILDVVEKLELGDGQFSRTVVNPDKGTAGSYHVSRDKVRDVIAYKHVLPKKLQEQIAWAETLLKQTRLAGIPTLSVSRLDPDGIKPVLPDGGLVAEVRYGEGYQEYQELYPGLGTGEAQTIALRNHVIANPEDEKNLAKAVVIVNNFKFQQGYTRNVKGKDVFYEAVDTSKLTTQQRKFLATYLYNSDVNQTLLRRNMNHLIRIQDGPAAGKQFINSAINAVIGQMDAVKAPGRGGVKKVVPGLVNRVAFLQDGFAGIVGNSYDFKAAMPLAAEDFINARREAAKIGYQELQSWYNIPPPALLGAETAEVAAEDAAARPPALLEAETAEEDAAAPGDGTFVNQDQVKAMVKYLYDKVDTVSDAVNPRQSLLEQ